jgi:hypothetical protein
MKDIKSFSVRWVSRESKVSRVSKVSGILRVSRVRVDQYVLFETNTMPIQYSETRIL